MTVQSRIGVAVALLLCGCASTPPREDVVHLLKSLGKGYQHRDAGEVAAFYANDFQVDDGLAQAAVRVHTEGDLRAQSARGAVDKDEFVRLLEARFADIADVDKAKFVLTDIREHDEGWSCDAWFEFIAIRSDSSRTFEESEHRFIIAEDEGELRIARHEVIRRDTVEGAGDHFSDQTEAAGLSANHLPHTPIEEGTPIIPGNFSGAGASAGDVDGDGWLDLIVGDGQRVRLYRNQRNGTFAEVTAASGLGTLDKVRGAYFFDYDNDGRLDLLFTRVRKPTMLWRNLDGAHFEDVTTALGGERPGQGESVVLADLDLDGDVDIYEVRYGEFNDSAWAYPLYDSTDGSHAVVRRNRGDGTFELIDDPVLSPQGWGLAATSGDYDGDGDPDLYLANDFGVNHLLRNDGDFKFTDVTDEAGCADQGLGMSASFGDVDNDGDLDLYVANMQSSASWIFDDPDFPLPLAADILMLRGFVADEMRKVTRGNSLFLNQGDGTFAQAASEYGVERNGWSWGANMLDYDNDGDLDIYCPNGYITGDDADDL